MAKKRSIESILGNGNDVAEDANAGRRTRASQRGMEYLSGNTPQLGASPVEVTQLRVDPDRCRLWSEHDRDYEALVEADCADLIEGFQTTTGQITPAIARRSGDQDHPYEIVAGARRLWTARHLGVQLLIEIRDPMDDSAAFQINDIDNRDRKDVSAIERARRYKRALGLFESQAKMAEALHMKKAHLTHHLHLADMHEDLLKAYGDPRLVPLRHVRELQRLLTEDEEGVLQRARELAEDPSERTPAQTLKRLEQSSSKRGRPKVPAQYYEYKGKRLLSVKRPTSKKLTMELSLKEGASFEDVEQVFRQLLKDHYPGD